MRESDAFDRMREYGMTMAQLLGMAAQLIRHRHEPHPVPGFVEDRMDGWLAMYERFVRAEAQRRRQA